MLIYDINCLCAGNFCSAREHTIKHDQSIIKYNYIYYVEYYSEIDRSVGREYNINIHCSKGVERTNCILQHVE